MVSYIHFYEIINGHANSSIRVSGFTQYNKILICYHKQDITYFLKQHKECTHNVTLRRFRANIIAVEVQNVLQISVCVCVRACVCSPQ